MTDELYPCEARTKTGSSCNFRATHTYRNPDGKLARLCRVHAAHRRKMMAVKLLGMIAAAAQRMRTVKS